MSRVRLGLVSLAAATLLVACGAVLGLEPLEFTDDAGAAADASSGPADGQVEVGDAAVSDAPLEAADASDAFIGCTAAYDFCDDFNGARTIQGQWPILNLVGTGNLSIEAGVLRAELKFADGGTTIHGAAVSRLVDWPATDGGARHAVHLQFRARVDSCSPQLTTIASFGWEPGINTDIWIVRQGGDCTARIEEIAPLDGGGTGYSGSGTLLVPLGVWQDYDLALTEAAPGVPSAATLKVAQATTSLTLTATQPPPKFFHLFGALNPAFAGTDALVFLDDYRVDYLK